MVGVSSDWFPLDVEFKFGAVSGQKADSAATVAGTGDAYAEMTIGLTWVWVIPMTVSGAYEECKNAIRHLPDGQDVMKLKGKGSNS